MMSGCHVMAAGGASAAAASAGAGGAAAAAAAAGNSVRPHCHLCSDVCAGGGGGGLGSRLVSVYICAHVASYL